MDNTDRWRALLAAVVLRAIHDAHHGNGSQQHEALIFQGWPGRSIAV